MVKEMKVDGECKSVSVNHRFDISHTYIHTYIYIYIYIYRKDDDNELVEWLSLALIPSPRKILGVDVLVRGRLAEEMAVDGAVAVPTVLEELVVIIRRSLSDPATGFFQRIDRKRSTVGVGG